MEKTVNLYSVGTCEGSSYFVFASTPNKARALCVRRDYDKDEDYISLRAYILAKNVGGLNDAVVEDETDRDYPRVLAAGCRFCTEAELELWEDR
jgi:radical SAM superfamily enzyme with C-terminal helix-hairpin-helix motif